jgi:glutamate-ammonia-ligase adenylyltransferase
LNRALPDPDNARTALERFRELHRDIPSGKKEILETLASWSSFLRRAVLRDPGILDYLGSSKTLKTKKEPSRFAEEAGGIMIISRSQAELQARLTQYKYRELARITYRDITGAAPFPDTMEELSDLACAVIESVVAYHRRDLGMDGAGGFVVLGMGKLGGRELNLSSDVDLIYIYRDKGDPDPFFKLGERATKTLSAVTEDGFLYRVDLGLRPGGSKSSVSIPFDGALEHYFYWGDTWERAAMIKARPVAGDMRLGAEFIREIEPFVYKKFLDYTSIEDLKDMKMKLDRLEKKRDVKLGRGGIREIEFFIQALQLVNGGAVKGIRESNTLSALQKLRANRIIDEEVHETLSSSYLFLRKVEHYIQIADERQTHKIPASPDEIEKLAKRAGLSGRDEFEALYADKTSAVSKIFKSLFYEPSEKTEEVGREFLRVADFLTEGNIDEKEAVDNLKKLGFKNPASAIDLFSKLLDPRRGALTREGRVTTRRVIPAFLGSILKSPDPDAALINLERFVSGIGWRTSIYAVLLENPDIMELLSKLFSTSGYLSNFLIRHPEYLDVITLRSVRTEFASKEDMIAELQSALSAESDYGGRLDAIRRFRHVETLKICLRDLNGEVDPFYVGWYLSLVAEAVLEVGLGLAWDIAAGKEKSEGEKGPRMTVLGMGKLGGRELSYNSDLDVIFIYDGKAEEHEFFSKLGQKVISVLSVPTGEGLAYKIDMGLRPSGRSGALVTSYGAFRKYQEESAQIWERQALIRAKPSAGDVKLGKRVSRSIEELVYGRPVPPDFHKEIKRLRARMETELARESVKKLNIKTGRGGIVDIEFLVQMLQLRHGGEHGEVRGQNTLDALNGLRDAGIIKEKEYEALSDGLYFLKRMENLLRLLHDRSINELYESDFEKLSAEFGMEPGGKELREKYKSKTNTIRKIYDRYFK